jgi:hypothetical protein
MEFYLGSDRKEEADRLHGFSVGKIDLDSDTCSLTFWPREARHIQGNKWKVVPDFSYELGGAHLPTSPIEVPLLRVYSAVAEESFRKPTAHQDVFVYAGGGGLVKAVDEPREGGRRNHRPIKEGKEEMPLVLPFVEAKEVK